MIKLQSSILLESIRVAARRIARDRLAKGRYSFSFDFEQPRLQREISVAFSAYASTSETLKLV